MSAKSLKKDTHNLNSLPDCVFVKPLFRNHKKERMTISFTILFGEHRAVGTLMGEIRFGIKRGELVLDIENGKIDPVDIEFVSEFSTQTKIDAIDENQDLQSKVRKHYQSLKGN